MQCWYWGSILKICTHFLYQIDVDLHLACLFMVCPKICCMSIVAMAMDFCAFIQHVIAKVR